MLIANHQVSRASKYVTRDIGVPWQIRFKRARALLLLGKVFTEVGCAFAGASSEADAGLDSVAAMKKVGSSCWHWLWCLVWFWFRFFLIFGKGGRGFGEQREGEEMKRKQKRFHFSDFRYFMVLCVFEK